VKLVPFALASLVLLLSCAPRDAVAPGADVSFAITAGNNYYVSPSGSDANPCSAASPCKTMQRVSQLLAPGEIAHFASGNYTWTTAAGAVAKSGTASARVTYISDVKWGAKISGGCEIMRNTGDYVDIVGFDMTGTCATGLAQDGSYGRVIGNRVHDLPGTSGWGGIVGNYGGGHHNQIVGNVVDNVGPFGATNTIHGIYFSGTDAVIMNNIVTRASAACITTYHDATRNIVSNNVVANCGRYGIQISADPAVTINDYSTVDNNIVVNVSGGKGIFEYNASAYGTHNVYNNNIVYNNSVTLVKGTQSGTITLTSAQFSALFVNYTGDKNGDYHLRSGAVAIDAGTTRCAAGVSNCVPLTDFDGVSRPQGAAYDIGAYEFPSSGPSGPPVALWHFDEGSGQTASDASGNNNTGSLGASGNPAWAAGRINSALQFDGVSSKVTVAPSASINNLSAFTYAAWIYRTGLGGNGSGRICSKESSANFDELSIVANASVFVNLYNTTGTEFATRVNDLPANTWSHVAVTYDDGGDRKVRVYLNGSEVAYVTQPAVSGTLRTTSNPLIIGNRVNGDRAFQGTIDEAQIYNRALSTSEVAALFNSAPPPPPVALWHFDAGSGQTASDASGNNNTATLGITTAAESSDPLWVQGRMSNALQFDGSSSRVTVPGSPTINNLSAFTYAAWIYPTGAGGGGYGRIFAKESSTGFDDFYFLGNTAIEADINNTVGTQFAARAAATLAWNAWSHVAVTYNDSGDRKLHLYLNGSEVAYSQQAVTSGTLRTTSNTLMTGNRIAGDRAFQGKIDDARVYNRALSTSEVAALFNSAP
jgi:hypothetical protein